jgi:hypothetical protein
MTVAELKERVKKHPFRFRLNAYQKMLSDLPEGCLLRIRNKKSGRRVYGVKMNGFDTALRVQSPNSPVERIWIEFDDPDHYWNDPEFYYTNFDIKRVA